MQTINRGAQIGMKKKRQLSRIQKKILPLILKTESFSSDPMSLRNIGRTVGEVNIHYSCHSLESLGLISLQRSRTRQLFLKLTDAGRTVAARLQEEAYTAEKERRQQEECRVLPFRPPGRETLDIEVYIRGRPYTANRATFIIRVDGSVSLALSSKNSGQAWLNGDAVQVAEWYQICYDAGLSVNVQVNDSLWSPAAPALASMTSQPVGAVTESETG
ncbi:Uncharacterised protein [Cedecea neteri]|uniref:Uncharacterized protein n=1 Tax=Cedecea neteri TaxID=158822 RepID=A0A291E6E3_9ENTR|nr:hypothetical protein [Cedecea neteri]ATF95496.1 hypothetical protein CO704_25840 [Cedecea neteri]SQC92068.1 Uncharacterised protein [Cedecea neteri]